MINLYITNKANRYTATVKTTKGNISGKDCGSEARAINSLNSVIKGMGKEIPQWNIIHPVSAVASFDFLTEAEGGEPTTERMPEVPEAEVEPELHPALRPTEGRISPLDQPERWVAIYRGVVARFGTDPEILSGAMKNMNCASPYERDSEGRPFHMYSDYNLVRAPRPGEGERRQTKGINGFNRDYKGRTPLEPGSVARDTDPWHPANKPEKAKRMTKEERKAANAKLKAQDPNGATAQNWCWKMGAAASQSAGGDRIAYKIGFVGTAQILGAMHLEKVKKFMEDLGIQAGQGLDSKSPGDLIMAVERLVQNGGPVSAEWIEWAKNARKHYEAKAA